MLLFVPQRRIKAQGAAERCVPHHVLPVEHLQDVAEQLAAGFGLLSLLQVELQLVRHQRQEDLTAICGDTHTQRRSERERSR